MVTEPSQVYACNDCGERKRLPESPSDGPKFIQTGCSRCKQIRRHHAVGRGVLL